MSEHQAWQVGSEAAVIYEQDFVPALFGPWAPRVADAAHIGPGDRVLDVGCGTGILAREAASRVGPSGQVTGLDLNAGMLAVARRLAPEIAWREGDAAALPFEDGVFDVVVCQFALMFFPQPAAALREMWRVLGARGGLGVAVWGPLECAPGEAVLTDVLERCCGQSAGDMLRAPFTLGDRDRLTDLLADAGLADAIIETQEGRARFASIDDFVRIEVKGSPINELSDETSYEALREETHRAMAPFCVDAGQVVFPMDGHIVKARKK